VEWSDLAGRYPVIVLEGCDGTGKTTLAAELADQHGYTVMHGTRIEDPAGLADAYRTVLSQPGKLALDRSFVSELVYGPLRVGHSRLTGREAAELAFALCDRGGVLVHLTGHPVALAARLRYLDGYAPTVDRLTAVVGAYRDVFGALDGAAPIVTVDTTARRVRRPV
jgi:predicted ATPase